MINGQSKTFEILPPKRDGWIIDPNDPNPLVLVEQYPPCEERIKRLKTVCGGHLQKPFCKAKSTFVIKECIHCGILAQKLSASLASSG